MKFISLISLISLVIHVSLSFDAMILSGLGSWLRTRLSSWIVKPLFDCLSCFGFWFGLVCHFALTNIDIEFFWIIGLDRPDHGILITGFAVAGLNTIIALFIRLIEAVENLESFQS